MLRDSIANLNTKFDTFNERISGKITAIERNYENLNTKIDNMARGNKQIEIGN